MAYITSVIKNSLVIDLMNGLMDEDKYYELRVSNSLLKGRKVILLRCARDDVDYFVNVLDFIKNDGINYLVYRGFQPH